MLRPLPRAQVQLDQLRLPHGSQEIAALLAPIVLVVNVSSPTAAAKPRLCCALNGGIRRRLRAIAWKQ
jgi:hypothetical protein